MDIKHYANNRLIVGENREFCYEQLWDRTAVFEIIGPGHYMPVPMPSVRYCLALSSGLSDAGNPGRAQFDADLLAAIDG